MFVPPATASVLLFLTRRFNSDEVIDLAPGAGPLLKPFDKYNQTKIVETYTMAVVSCLIRLAGELSTL